MRCRTVRATADRDEDDNPVVCITMGNMRRVGAVDEFAYAEIPPSMARQIAVNLIDAADVVERTLAHKLKWSVELRGTITRDIKRVEVEASSMGAAMVDAVAAHPTYRAKSATEIQK